MPENGCSVAQLFAVNRREIGNIPSAPNAVAPMSGKAPKQKPRRRKIPRPKRVKSGGVAKRRARRSSEKSWHRKILAVCKSARRKTVEAETHRSGGELTSQEIHRRPQGKHSPEKTREGNESSQNVKGQATLPAGGEGGKQGKGSSHEKLRRNNGLVGVACTRLLGVAGVNWGVCLRFIVLGEFM